MPDQGLLPGPRNAARLFRFPSHVIVPERNHPERDHGFYHCSSEPDLNANLELRALELSDPVVPAYAGLRHYAAHGHQALITLL